MHVYVFFLFPPPLVLWQSLPPQFFILASFSIFPHFSFRDEISGDESDHILRAPFLSDEHGLSLHCHNQGKRHDSLDLRKTERETETQRANSHCTKMRHEVKQGKNAVCVLVVSGCFHE